jgi:hypothetical protein
MKSIKIGDTRNKNLTVLWVVLGIFGRLIPHPPGFTPLTNLCLFAGSKFSKIISLLLILVALVLSDILLAHIYGYAVFSKLSIFTYLGWFGMMFLGSSRLMKKPLLCIFSAELLFWVWTNFGYWLVMNLYPKNLAGLFSCYVAALPFLRNALCGDLVWFLVIFVAFNKCRKLAQTQYNY